MPSRLIRDGLLESEAVLSLPVEARWLFVAILLSADDVGLFEATEFHLSRKADVGRAMVSKLLQMLVDADLVRLYKGPGMRDLGFIPRFRQRLQIQRTKLPAPPPALYADDDDAVRKFNDLAEKTSVEIGGQRKSTVGQPPEPNLNLTKEEGKTEEKTASSGGYSADFERAWAVYPPRPGRSKSAAWKAWTARVKAGAVPQKMIDGISAYAAYCAAMKTEPQYIKQPETFLGPREFWLADWAIGSGARSATPRSPFSRNIDGQNYSEGIDGHGNLL